MPSYSHRELKPPNQLRWNLRIRDFWLFPPNLRRYVKVVSFRSINKIHFDKNNQVITIQNDEKKGELFYMRFDLHDINYEHQNQWTNWGRFSQKWRLKEILCSYYRSPLFFTFLEKRSISRDNIWLSNF